MRSGLGTHLGRSDHRLVGGEVRMRVEERKAEKVKYLRSAVGWTPKTPEGLMTCRRKIEEKLEQTRTLDEAMR